MRRRELLSAGSILVAGGLSGCMGVVPGLGGGGGGGDSTGITKITPEGRGVIVHLNPNWDISELNLLGSGGDTVVSETISDTQTQVKIVLAKTGNTNMGRGVTSAYRVGEYTIQVTDSNGNPTEYPVTFSPELSISNVGFLTNLEDPPALNNALAMNAAVMFQFNNTGNAPAIVDDTAIEGPRVPNPVDPTSERNYDKKNVPYGAAMYRLSERASVPRTSIAIPAGGSTWYRTAAYPAAVPIRGIPSVTGGNAPDGDSSADLERPPYSNTSAVRNDYIKPPIKATASFTAGTGDVSTDFTFTLSGRINSATSDSTDYFYFLDQQVTQIAGSRRGLD